MNELRRTELIKLVNETIDATNDVPVIDAPSVAKAALERMPPDEPRPDWLGVELEEIADDILHQRFDPVFRLRHHKEGAGATKLVDQYFAVLEKVGGDNIDHPALEDLCRRMTGEELIMVGARLQEEGEANLAEAKALEEFGRRKGFSRDNSS
jgi:hypothetical protein